jgi:hypothetical protein
MIKWLVLLIALFGVLGAQDRPGEELNRRLESLFALEEEKSPSADLYVNIADTFYQFGQYPWTLLYSERALKYSPGNLAALELKRQSQQKLFLDETQVAAARPLLQPGNALAAFFVFLFVFFALASLHLWKKSDAILWSGAAALIISALFLLIAIHLQYFSPLPAIIVNSTAVYRGEGVDYPFVSDHPLPAGSKVGVMETSDDGEWLKIEASNGMIGFIPIKVIRII